MKTIKRPVVLGESGMTLIEMGIAAAISIVLVGGAVGLVKSWQDRGQQIMSSGWLTQTRSDISISLQDAKAFDATMHRPENAASFACLLNKSDCRGAGGPIVIQAKAGLRGLSVTKPILRQVYNPFDAAHPNAGLTAKGDPCDLYNPNPAGGDDRCPFRFTANWQALCPGSGKCFDPGVEIDVVLTYHPSPASTQKMLLNAANYSVTFRKGQAVSDTQSLCDSVRGHMDAAGHCVTTLTTGCPSGEFILGFDDDSNPYCGFTFGGLDPSAAPHMCPLGQVLLGIDGNGVAHCGPGCADPGSSDLSPNIFPNSSL